MKTCSKCKERKPLDDFSKRARATDGLASWCKRCFREYRDNTKEQRKEKQKQYYQKKRSLFLRKAKEYRIENKEAISVKQKEYVRENKERLDIYHAEYREANRERINRKSVEYARERYRRDVSFCLISRVRSIMQNALKRKGFIKRQRTIGALGCTAEEFKEHIERQFLKGMSWDNRDKWHLDHIIPISSASTEDEIYALSHFTNIRPMWAEDNKRKADKITSLL